MSDMLKRYEQSDKPRITQARQIPELKANVVDIQNEFQTQFQTFTKYGDPTTYTAKSLDWYTNERQNMTVNESFQPTEPGTQLSRWTPGKGYYNPGRPSGL